MTLRQPFTALCQKLARSRAGDRVDLHIHTIHSDGEYTPAQVVDLARRCGLPALAITDHDTVAGFRPALAAAATKLEIVAGVELTAQFHDEEFHLLGYFFRPEDETLAKVLQKIRLERVQRFREMVENLERRGISLEAEEAQPAVLGRRYLAERLVQARHAGSQREAFHRYLNGGDGLQAPLVGLPVAEAIAVIRQAGGVAAWAHPFYDCTRETLMELRGLGLQAVEAEYPGWKKSRTRQLRTWASKLGLAVTGGSDCHGPGPRMIGTSGITLAELDRIRQLATS